MPKNDLSRGCNPFYSRVFALNFENVLYKRINVKSEKSPPRGRKKKNDFRKTGKKDAQKKFAKIYDSQKYGALYWDFMILFR